MTDSTNRSMLFTTAGLMILAVGLAVFAIRLQHAGPYAMPHSGALYGGLGAILIGIVLIYGSPRVLCWIALAASPVALFPSIYSIMGESEEVISLYATDADNNPADLRLWIVDRDDGAWLGMPRTKAIDHSLDGSELQMLRHGEMQCVIPVLHEDRPTVEMIHGMKVQKYSAAQLAGSLGLYPLEATESTVVLRLDPC